MSTKHLYSLEEVGSWVEAQLKRLSENTLKKKPNPVRRKRREEPASELPAFESIRAGCAWLASCCEDEQLPEPDWYALAGIVGRCENGAAHFHEVSAADARYDEIETDSKLAHAIEAAGPRTCERILSDLGHVGCTNCTFYGKINSPIGLGKLDPRLAKLMVSHVFITTRRIYLDLYTGKVLSSTAFSDKFRHIAGKYTPHFVLTSHHLTPKVDTMEYVPGNTNLFLETESGQSAVNIWKDDGVKPLKGDCSTVLQHMEKLIPDSTFRDHVLDCLAFLVQKPGQKIGHALLISGKQGTGKSLLFHLLGKLVGPTNYRSIVSEQLSSRFAAQMANLRLMTIEELNTFEKMEVYNTLKTWITERLVRVEEKNVAFFDGRTPDLIFGVTNHESPIHLEPNDRRFAFYISPMEPQNEGYYDRLAKAVDAEAPAFADWLMKRDISLFNPAAHPPMTDAKAALTKSSRTVIAQEVETLMIEERFPFTRDLVTLQEVRREVQSITSKSPTIPELTRAMKTLGAVNLNKPVRIQQGSSSLRLWAWRNVDQWLEANPDELREHYLLSSPIDLDG